VDRRRFLQKKGEAGQGERNSNDLKYMDFLPGHSAPVEGCRTVNEAYGPGEKEGRPLERDYTDGRGTSESGGTRTEGMVSKVCLQ